MSWKKYTIEKVTPRFDRTWYIKWIASLLILIATAARSVGTVPHIDLWFGLFGTLGWFWVGMLWSDRSLIILNIIATLIYWQGIGLWYINSQ